MWIICQDRCRVLQVSKITLKKKKIQAPEEAALAEYDSADRAEAVFRQLTQAVKNGNGSATITFEMPLE